MKRITNLLLVALAVLGLASCQKGANSDLPNGGENEGNTYVGLNILFPGATLGGTKAAPEDYNKITGEWKGRDVIKQIDVYLVNGNDVDATSFTADSFFGIDNNGLLSPKMAVKAKSGDNVKAYVVINDVKGKITGQLTGVTGTEFDAKFKAVVKVANLDDLSSYADGKEIIVMTNSKDPEAKAIVADVTEEQAKNGVANRIDVEVLRLTSRAIVTVKEDISKEVTVKNKLVNASTGAATDVETAKVTISKISYATEGGALQVNPIQAADFKAAADVYSFVPEADKTWEEVKTAAANVFTYDAELKLIPRTSYIQTNNAEGLKPALEGEEFAMSLLPVTHEDGKYYKGNTPFFTIAAEFKAENIVPEVEIGGVKYKAETLTAAEGTTVYLGVKTGLFYSTKQKAQSMDPENAETGELAADQIKQEVKEFTNGLMYYNVWINPDQPYSGTEKITKSPVYRNQVYNAHITGFKEIGMTNTYDKPFKPDDPLESDKTYLSVQLKVLPYTIHSYTVDLGNRY